MRRTRRAALLALAVLVVVDLTFRLVAPHLPEPLEWSSQEAQAKLARMDRLRGRADVALVGSSVVDLGVDPDTIGQPAYNAALRGASADIIATWTDDVVAPQLRPRTVVIGLTSRELTPNDPEQANATRDFSRAPAVRQTLGTERWVDRADRALSRVSEIFRYRTVLRLPMQWSGRKRLDSGVELAQSGWDRSAAEGTYGAPAGLLNYFRTIPLRDFTVGRHEEQRLAALATSLRARGIKVVVVNMPVTEGYLALHPRGADDYHMATAAIQEVARQSGSAFMDAGIWPTALFSDPIHLNGVGAERLGRRIGQAVDAAR